MRSLLKLFTGGASILVLSLLSVQSAYANPVSIPGPETGFLLGLVFVVIAVVFSARAINKIKKRRDKV